MEMYEEVELLAIFEALGKHEERCVIATECFWSKVNIWNVNCARATAFIFDTRTGVLVKVSKFF